jgi:excinuclease ABC subunit C
MTALRDTVARIPHEPGVYRFLGAEGEVLYVGKAKDLRKRVGSYFRPHGTPHGRTGEMLAVASDIEWVVTSSETEALLLEDNFIKEERPPFNLRLRDDKSYPYIEVTLSEEWPRVRFMRGRHVRGNLYFGPYSSARKVRETLDVIGRIFPYRKCKGDKPGRASGSPCLQYFIHRSLAPCDHRVSHEEYLEVVAEVVDFLRGRLTEVTRSIETEMTAAARNQEFEKAALLRDRLAAVAHVQERQSARAEGTGSFDVIGLCQDEPGANVQVFRAREGALVDRQAFYVENAAGREAATVLEEFLLEFYWEPAMIPAEVIVPVDDLAEAAAVLSARRGAAVTVRRAQRGQKRHLLELAQHNAELDAQTELDRARRRRDSRITALERLRDVLGLASLPLRIECYDISNLGEQHAVGSMVVFAGGLPKKAHYRKFAIRDVVGQDDFAMMNEVLRRRFEHPAVAFGAAAAASTAVVPLTAAVSSTSAASPASAAAAAPAAAPYDESFAARPDLIIVDGGKGQLSAALAAMRAAGQDLPVIGLAKQHEEVYLPGVSEPLDLAADDPGSLLLQRVRDEAHRFAVSFHRQRRDSDLRRATIFDALPQVGPVRRRRILAHFGSPERFVAASRDELEQVPGLPAKVGREIYAHLHKAG